jgi:heme/copper-type cytochrome/quinol oxidase subunit 2
MGVVWILLALVGYAYPQAMANGSFSAYWDLMNFMLIATWAVFILVAFILTIWVFVFWRKDNIAENNDSHKCEIQYEQAPEYNQIF